MKFKPSTPPVAKTTAADDWVPQSCADVLVRYWREPTGEEYGYPYHLKPLVDIYDRCVDAGNVECAVHAPVQHGKTQLSLAFLIYFALKKPGFSHIYSTYSATRADEVRLSFEGYALAAGLNPQGSGDAVTLRGGTTIRFVSAEGAITGNPCTGVALVDDPFKGFADANSLAHRTRVHQGYDSVIGTRVHPGASRIVLAARWHPEDLTGYVIRDTPESEDGPAIKGFDYLRIPALCDDPENDPLHRKLGDPAWPEKRPKAWLARKQRNRAVWAALYQGDPKSAADLKFHGEAPRFSMLPTTGLVHGHGMDLAFTVKTSSDHSCFVSGVRVGSRLFVTSMRRVKVDPEVFKLMAVADYNRQPARAVFFGSGPEMAWARRYRNAGMHKLELIRAQKYGDKLARATLSGLLDAWNNGNVQIPIHAPWAAELEAEVLGFTGKDGEPDDIVDALSGLAQAVGLASANGVGWDVNEMNKRLGTSFKRARAERDGGRSTWSTFE
jgi:phage terminase large subunit-like protein